MYIFVHALRKIYSSSNFLLITIFPFSRILNYFLKKADGIIHFFLRPGSSVEEQKPSKLKVVGSIPPPGTTLDD